jgi:glycine dehydrogenase subunit 2
MITNPNTCGLFERDMKAIADAVHAAGGFVYCDGANFNAIVGRVRPGDLGVDAMHINLHKTFSTPHGGGGPGSGRWCCRRRSPLRAAAVRHEGCRWRASLVEEETPRARPSAESFGRMCAFHGQMGMFTRALAYILSHGADGLKQVAEDAVLNANYVLRSLEDVLDAPVRASGPCMHEALFSDKGWPRASRRSTSPRADRRGLSPDDDVFPAGRPWRDADRADRDREQGGARPVHRAKLMRSLRQRRL